MTGTNGLIGSALVDHFVKSGHNVTKMLRPGSRKSTGNHTVIWDIDNKSIDQAALEGQDVVIHLAGASIADKRWSKAYKNIILKSRINSTCLLCDTLSKLERPPRLFLCASAVGYYGLQDADVSIDESSASGDDFLAGVCKEWEKASEPAKQAGIRVVQLRFGAVLSPKGGALAKMLPISSSDV